MARRCLRCLFFRLRFLGRGGRRNLFPRGGGIMWMGIMIFVLLRSRRRKRGREAALWGGVFFLLFFSSLGGGGGTGTYTAIGMDGRGDMNE